MIFRRDKLAINDVHEIEASVVTLDESHGLWALVLDNFYRDPGYVRSLALELDYQRTRGRFPGYEARISLDPSPMLKVLGRFMGHKLVAEPQFDDQLVFSMISREIPAAYRWQPFPHIDGVEGVAGVLYLNPPGRCRGGTAFYRHRATGLMWLPDKPYPGLRAVLARRGFATAAELADSIVKRNLALARRHRRARSLVLRPDPRRWELVKMLEMRFNRFVLYPGRIFHSVYMDDGDFGETPAARRLTQTLFTRLAP